VRLALRRKQPELLERGAILLQENATPHRHRDVQNLMQRSGWEVLAHPPYSPDLAPCDYWLFSCVKEHLQGKRVDSEDDINTPVTAFKSVRPRTNIELQLIVYHVDGKSVWTVLMITLSRGHMCKHSGISIVFLSSILLLQ
jgi:histone-lysine N-methyltransferase SETMAR